LTGVAYAAVAAVFVVALYFVDSYRRRARPASTTAADAQTAATHIADPSEVFDAARRVAAAEAQLIAERLQVETEARRREAEAERVGVEAQLLADQARQAKEAADRREAELAELLSKAKSREEAHDTELQRIAGLTSEQARAEVLQRAEVSGRRAAAALGLRIEEDARKEAESRARVIVAEAVARVASAQTAESVVSVMHLPGEEMKGRIIGREGRNIRAFETVTGVNVIIDDTPEAVLLSCFDPVRREVGRLTLERLVTDGRIHPHRIEEAYEASKIEVEQLCLHAADDALAEVGVTDLDERLLPTLGRLKYRTSYGQNVLGHLIETAHVAGIMAAELGIEPTTVKRAAFLHDIGKALTHEVEGSHALVGAALLRKYGESEIVTHAVEAHHNEVPPTTIEAVLTQAADTCSASRPGARRESLETYVHRLTRIEEIGNAQQGVEKVFAMQAGREVRVMVKPSMIDDAEAAVLAKDIAHQIEDELTYPGQIRVTVIREVRTTEIAH